MSKDNIIPSDEYLDKDDLSNEEQLDNSNDVKETMEQSNKISETNIEKPEKDAFELQTSVRESEENGTEENESETLKTINSKENNVGKEKNEWFKKIDELDEKNLMMKLKNSSREDQDNLLNYLKKTNFYLLKESEIYEFMLNEDETIRDTLDSVEIDEDQFEQESVEFSFPIKCYFAKMKIDLIEKEFDSEKSLRDCEIQNLKFRLESLNMSMKDLKESKEKFNRDITVGGRHPVTKKVILQKIAKYFKDSVQNKMALTNRYKIQAESDIMERSKILNQIKAQEKRLASLDITEYQKTEFEHMKCCQQLGMLKEQLGKFKMKFSPLLQSLTEMKRNLERGEIEMERMKNAVSKLERLKDVMINEQTRNDHKVQELKKEMRKIKLDPRRHNIPEVIDYAAAKRENAAMRKEIQKWKQKVQLAQQKKALYLKTLSKKKL